DQEKTHVLLHKDIWYIENALTQELLNGVLQYVETLREEIGLARLYQVGSCKTSFWYPFSRRPVHVIEDVIRSLQAYVDLPSSCSGAEWWLNVRPSNEGMESHFDKDESLLKRCGQIRCPERSSVLYMCDIGLPTLCTNYSLD